MTTRTQASRSAGSAPRRTWIARMPPAEPTTATTWIGRRSAVGARAVPGKHAANRVRLLPRFAGELLEPGLAALGTRAPHAPGEPLGELRAFLQGAQRRPEGHLDRLALRLHRSFRGVGVTDPAAEPGELGVVDLPEHTPAFRASVYRRRPRRPFTLERLGVERRVLGLDAHLVVAILADGNLLGKPPDCRRNRTRELGEREDAIRVVANDGVRRQRREGRVVGILDEDAAAACTDGARPRDAVVSRAGTHDCERPVAKRQG